MGGSAVLPPRALPGLREEGKSRALELGPERMTTAGPSHGPRGLGKRALRTWSASKGPRLRVWGMARHVTLTLTLKQERSLLFTHTAWGRRTPRAPRAKWGLHSGTEGGQGLWEAGCVVARGWVPLVPAGGCRSLVSLSLWLAGTETASLRVSRGWGGRGDGGPSHGRRVAAGPVVRPVQGLLVPPDAEAVLGVRP